MHLSTILSRCIFCSSGVNAFMQYRTTKMTKATINVQFIPVHSIKQRNNMTSREINIAALTVHVEDF